MKIVKLAQVCLAVATLVLIPTAAICEDEYPAPAREESVPWLAILYAVVCLGGIAAVAFKHAKRTHLD